MLKILAVFVRVLKQIVRDYRLITMMFVGPILILYLMYMVFFDQDTRFNLGIVLNQPGQVSPIEFLEKEFNLIYFKNTQESINSLEKEELLVSLDFTKNKDKITILLEGTKPLQSRKIILKIFNSFLESSKTGLQNKIDNTMTSLKKKLYIDDLKEMQQSLKDEDGDKIASLAEKFRDMPLDITIPNIDISHFPTDPSLFFDIIYIFGSSELTYFDSIGPTLVAFLVFFIVFLIGGIAFLRERNTQTLSRTFSTPVKEYQVIMGYFIAFFIFILVQVCVLQFYSTSVLKMINNGSFLYLVMINVMVCFNGLVLGFIFSTISQSEFQLVQFVPMVIIPQFIFSGIFDTSSLPESLNFIGDILPLHYASTALIDVAIRGRGWDYVVPALKNLSIFLFIFLSINTLLLKQIRRRG